MAQKYKDNAVGERIKQARRKLGWTQNQLGKIAGIHEVQIRGYENGTRTPKKETIDKIADAMKIPSKWFLYGDDPDISYLDMFTGEIDIEKVVLIANGESDKKIDNKAEQSFLDLLNKFNEDRKKEAAEQMILEPFNKLNDAGKQKAVEYTTDLAQMPKYQSDPDTKK